jgi:2-keto-3-deoxy-L-rhamnonate aldolase RhmA
VANGVNQIFVDLELNGKIERQGHLDTVISRHTIEDVQRIRNVLPNGRLLVRINPIFEGSAAEIDAVIKSGADTLMLPMFKGADEVEVFTAMVAGRARCCLLVETVAATKNIEACLKVPGVDQVHIGLNDLHLELGIDFMFEPLANGMLDELCAKIRKAGIPFGIGGVARVGEGMLPAELLLGEHVRLGSSWAILSRTFHRQANTVQEIQEHMDFGQEIIKLREKYFELLDVDAQRLNEIHEQVKKSVRQIVRLIRTRKGLSVE